MKAKESKLFGYIFSEIRVYLSSIQLILFSHSFKTMDYSKNINLTAFSEKIHCLYAKENWSIYLFLLFQITSLLMDRK